MQVSSYNLEKLSTFKAQFTAKEQEVAKLPKGTYAKRIAESELKALERKIRQVEDRISLQQSKIDLESIIENVAKIPLMELQLSQWEKQYQDLAESIREKRADLEILKAERAKLLAEDSSK